MDMYKSVTILDSAEHGDLRYKAPEDLGFARDLNNIPITYTEIGKVCCDYPIVFTGSMESPTLSIVTGFKKEEGNLAIDAEGNWVGDYIPAFVRRYPFTLATIEENKLAVGFDLQSGCFNDPSGVRLYEDDGKATSVLEGVQNFLASFEKEIRTTVSMAQELMDKGVLKETVLTLGEGEEQESFGGLMIIDMDKVRKLDDDVTLDWARRGFFEMFALIQRSYDRFQPLIARRDASDRG
jgi:putative transposase